MTLCAVIAIGLYFWDRDRVWKRSNAPLGIWTVSMQDEVTPYTFRGPLAMFRIHFSQVASRRKLLANFTSAHSLTMEWHFESGQPWVLWALDNRKNRSLDNEIKLYATVNIVSADTDTAAIAKSVYLDRRINTPNPAQAAKPMRKVWNNTASEFEGPGTIYYLIEDREQYDGQVITCDNGATYCSLRGARVTDTLELSSVLVLKEDVANWKQYQDKARSLIKQTIVDATSGS